MEKEQLGRYSPANAKNLTAEEITAMQSFTKDDLKELAAAYPNNAHGTAYLILYDKSKKPKEQLFSLSTWKNLFELVKMGNTNYYAVSFKQIFNKKEQHALTTAPVQDLTKEEALNAPGLKSGKAAAAKTPAKQSTLPKAEMQNLDEENKGGAKIVALDKMDKQELAAKYKEVSGKDPGSRMGKKEMIAAIEKASK
jgi:hypothetical protein